MYTDFSVLYEFEGYLPSKTNTVHGSISQNPVRVDVAGSTTVVRVYSNFAYVSTVDAK
jgi:hypothetical protein